MNVEMSQKSFNLFNTTTEQRLEQRLQSFERLVKNEKEYMFLMSRRYIKMLRRALAFSRIIDGTLLDEHTVMRTGQEDLAGMKYNFNIPPQFIRYLENIIFMGIDPRKIDFSTFIKWDITIQIKMKSLWKNLLRNPSQQGPSNIQNQQHVTKVSVQNLNTAVNNYEQTVIRKRTVLTGTRHKYKQY
ncbi:hypothetical protein AVEN_158035-1 [Araneus ventricosus]|uniref:Uncharacterized protein n=1 Tax=Araneus ventricosus TaxID=182803 RepID=A0A4Y2RMS0_ARAVE|nr:hypothetical protein AVEN_158035-1 [Araneus ventricosus]